MPVTRADRRRLAAARRTGTIVRTDEEIVAVWLAMRTEATKRTTAAEAAFFAGGLALLSWLTEDGANAPQSFDVDGIEGVAGIVKAVRRKVKRRWWWRRWFGR